MYRKNQSDALMWYSDSIGLGWVEELPLELLDIQCSMNWRAVFGLEQLLYNLRYVVEML